MFELLSVVMKNKLGPTTIFWPKKRTLQPTIVWTHVFMRKRLCLDQDFASSPGTNLFIVVSMVIVCPKLSSFTIHTFQLSLNATLVYVTHNKPTCFHHTRWFIPKKSGYWLFVGTVPSIFYFPACIRVRPLEPTLVPGVVYIKSHFGKGCGSEVIAESWSHKIMQLFCK